MRKLYLLLLIVFSWSCPAQIVGFPPPPLGYYYEYAIDLDNDGFTTFNLDSYISRYRQLLSNGNNGVNLSLYAIQMYTYQNQSSISGNLIPITTSTFINTNINKQHCKMTVLYAGIGPNYDNTWEYYAANNTGHELRALPYNGDFDNDGVINGIEDLNGNLDPQDDNTDGDYGYNFNDNDDDNDGILTINEDYNNNGSVLDDDMNLNGIIDYLDNLAGGTLNLNLKLFIEGYYNGSNAMKSVLHNQDGISPLTDVETITIELRHAAAPFEVKASTTSLLKTNGTVTCSFPTASVGFYYILVKSRNGLETWSATPQSINTTTLTYDFSTAANKAFGGNMKNLESGVFGFYTGDINHDGNIDTIDYPTWEIDANNFLAGIFTTDLNGDGNVDTIDYPILEINTVNYISVSKP